MTLEFILRCNDHPISCPMVTLTMFLDVKGTSIWIWPLSKKDPPMYCDS